MHRKQNGLQDLVRGKASCTARRLGAWTLLIAAYFFASCAYFPTDPGGPNGIRPDRWGVIDPDDWFMNQCHSLGGWSANPIPLVPRYPGDEWEFIENDTSITANCLLPYLITGHSQSPSAYHKFVWQGIEILLQAQDERGLFVSNDQPGWLYRQASVVRALSFGFHRAGRRSDRDRLKRAVERGEDALNVTADQWSRATDIDALLRLRVMLMIAHGMNHVGDERITRNRELKAALEREFARKDLGDEPTNHDYVRDLKHLRDYGSYLINRGQVDWNDANAMSAGPFCDDPQRTLPDLRVYWSDILSRRKSALLAAWQEQLEGLLTVPCRHSVSPRPGTSEATIELQHYAQNLAALVVARRRFVNFERR